MDGNVVIGQFQNRRAVQMIYATINQFKAYEIREKLPREENCLMMIELGAGNQKHPSITEDTVERQLAETR